MRTRSINHPTMQSSCPTFDEAKAEVHAPTLQKAQLCSTESNSLQGNPPEEDEVNKKGNQIAVATNGEKIVSETTLEPDKLNLFTVKRSNTLVPLQLESSTVDVDTHRSDLADLNGSLVPYKDAPDWLPSPSTVQSLNGLIRSPYQNPWVLFSDVITPSMPQLGNESWDENSNIMKCSSHADQPASSPDSLRVLSDEANNQSGIYSCLELDEANGACAIVDSSILNSVLSQCPLKDSGFPYSSDCPHTQYTTPSIADSEAFSLQDLTDNSSGTSWSNGDFDEGRLLQNGSWQHVAPPMRTYTKVQKAGSVGWSIDVTSFNNYDELRSAIECMFGLEGLLDDQRGSGWKLVYVDFEDDVILVGDDPWEEFIRCIQSIRVLSPSELQQMSEEGMQLLSSNTPIQGIDDF
ncbi:hypothetical protein Nepgr_015505 [Nepenthes gracilis]|uniref:Auxin-responsive protein n=1 Tax=Nepenthes gracilis TaxID=150966 RepID=A0AAD3XR63_NEPGR|nr:hypothetical protein Nepgr_015505 [Nepenthes gracilis]